MQWSFLVMIKENKVIAKQFNNELGHLLESFIVCKKYCYPIFTFYVHSWVLETLLKIHVVSHLPRLSNQTSKECISKSLVKIYIDLRKVYLY